MLHIPLAHSLAERPRTLCIDQLLIIAKRASGVPDLRDYGRHAVEDSDTIANVRARS